jgi:hypothetical protein
MILYAKSSHRTYSRYWVLWRVERRSLRRDKKYKLPEPLALNFIVKKDFLSNYF